MTHEEAEALVLIIVQQNDPDRNDSVDLANDLEAEGIDITPAKAKKLMSKFLSVIQSEEFYQKLIS